MEALRHLDECETLPCDEKDSRYTKSFDARRVFDFADDGEKGNGTKSLSIVDNAEHEKLKLFYEEFGFVVIRNVYDADECAVSRNAMCELTQLNPTDIESWKDMKPAGKYGLSTRGPTFDSVLVNNRQNPYLALSLASVLGLENNPSDVMVSHDRFTVYRATRPVDPQTGEEVDMSRFITGPANIHLDLNPWWWQEGAMDIIVGAESLHYKDNQDFVKENNLVVNSMGPHVQCVINFVDNVAEDGGTLVVPRFHKHVEQWCCDNKNIRKPLPWVTMPPTAEEPLMRQARRVCMREGSVLIWHQTVAHGTCPNNSSRNRMAQFIKAFSREQAFSAVYRAPPVPPPKPAKTKKNKNKEKAQAAATTTATTTTTTSTSDAVSVHSNIDRGTATSIAPSPTTGTDTNHTIAGASMADDDTAATASSATTTSSSSSSSTAASSSSAVGTLNPRLRRRADALIRELSASGAIHIVTPLGRSLFGLEFATPSLLSSSSSAGPVRSSLS